MKKETPIVSPVGLLKPYQKAVYDDPARFIAWIAGRQVGKSFTGAARAVAHAMRKPKTDFLIASPSERQSYEAIKKCKDWADAFNFALSDESEDRTGLGALMRSATIQFQNGSRIIAVPGKPDTVRGFSADVWMDEFAFFEDPDATWKAIFPSISNPLKGLKTAFITSTPNGKGGRGKRFYEIVTNKGELETQEGAYTAGPWSVHKTPITRAAPFLGTNLEELRKAVDDEEAWQQEFMCDFIDATNVLLPYELIQSCESAEATLTFTPMDYHTTSNAVYGIFCGIDFGRTSDPTVCWTLQRVGDVMWTREVLCIKNTSTTEQMKILSSRIVRADRVCIDATGPGVGFGDMAVDLVGRYDPVHHLFGKVSLETFTLPFKRQIFPALRVAFEQKKVRVPIDVNVREDLHEMQQVISNGEYNYTARRTAEGHSDRCTALALAIRAASFGGNVVKPFSIGRAHNPDTRRIWL